MYAHVSLDNLTDQKLGYNLFLVFVLVWW